jgi:hypothetical protein
MINKMLSRHTGAWLGFVAIVIAYGLIYAPFGLENNDGGFILGLSYQSFIGGSFFEDIVYVRPPVSPILHSFVFHYPFSLAPVFVDRIFVFLEIATYSILSSLLAKKLFSWGSAFTAVLAAIIFAFAVHSFPPMGWHTIDGIFFSVIALYLFVRGLDRRPLLLFFSACFAMLAAGSKQSYYLTPVVMFLLSLTLNKDRRLFLITVASLVAASLLLLLMIGHFGSVPLMWKAIASQTSLHDLFQAGVRDYIGDLLQTDSLLIAAPLLFVLVFSFLWREKDNKFLAFGLLAAIWIFLLITTRFYVIATGWAQPLSAFDTVFIITFLYSIAATVMKHDKRWLVISAMHVIAWTASISWGYLTAIFYPAPSVITLAYLLQPACKKYPAVRILSLAVLPASLIMFNFSNRFSYSLEGTVQRASLTANMEEVSPLLKFIVAEPEKHRLYRELLQLTSRFSDGSYVVLPNMPLAHMLTGSKNPIGIDWALNAEVGKNEKVLTERLASSVAYIIVNRHARPQPESTGKFGSAITVHVKNNWQLVESSENFLVFLNPSMSAKFARK